MAITKAWMTWTGPESDVLGLSVDPWIRHWRAVSTDYTLVVILKEEDENDKITGCIAGLEIVGFLEFEAWEKLPDLGLLWQVADWDPLPLVDLLQREQQAL